MQGSFAAVRSLQKLRLVKEQNTLAGIEQRRHRASAAAWMRWHLLRWHSASHLMQVSMHSQNPSYPKL
jgi:hypothetical protein